MFGPSIAVMIITRNRLDSLKRCLRCIVLQTYPAAEIVVVDSSSDSATGDFIAMEMPTVRYFRVELGMGAQPTMRNIALKHSSSEIVAAVDDDGYAEPGWLAALAECYRPGVGAVGGRILQGHPESGTETLPPTVGLLSPVRGAVGNFNTIWPELIEVDHLQGTNMSFRRSLLIQVGGWDTQLESGYAAYEDTEMCLRIKRLGYSVIYTPKGIVQHGLETREGGFTRNLGRSPRLAYSVSRNAAYSIFKNYQTSPALLFGAGLLAPLVNIARVLLPKEPGRSRRLAFSTSRLLAALAVSAGHVSGMCRAVIYAMSGHADSSPRLLPRK